jgi:hypothetical protein
MKILITICLLIATTFTVKAQDGKPTKEQTIEYLKSVLLGVEGGKYLDGPAGSTLLNFLDDIKLEGCILKLKSGSQKIQYGEKLPKKIWPDYGQEIDFSTVESFKIKLEEISGDWIKYNENLYLYYDIKKYKNNWVVGFHCKPEDSEKVLKALNHLRKLCGAPEPIKFD